MPLLMCPACNGGMKELNREGVQIDMCTECRGVWLDRGELEKLLSLARSETGMDSRPVPQQPATPPQPGWGQSSGYPPQQPYPPQHGYGHPHHYKKKSKLERVFDIFD